MNNEPVNSFMKQLGEKDCQMAELNQKISSFTKIINEMAKNVT